MKNPISREKAQIKYKIKQKSKGKCLDCSKKASKGKVLCEFHLMKHRISNKKYKEKLRKINV
jgi:hypothetical protein